MIKVVPSEMPMDAADTTSEHNSAFNLINVGWMDWYREEVARINFPPA
jgi:hypothetical protein